MKYRLLQYHMACNTAFLFGHAIVSGILATGNTLDTYEKYKQECQMHGITYYNEECYNEFMTDCGRKTSGEAVQS